MSLSIPCPASTPYLSYGWAARATHALCTWLLAHFGQPRLSAEEAFLAASTDAVDCERRQRWLARRHEQAWRGLPPA